ncbi:MAG: pyrroline-5-carboxylate reductase [Bacteroidia bacterium]|nr:pyrroline-5-carboxylate reductase [Bacteroidia bacterium]MCX7651887.1 pyrroline-5-carboxylate reductase [Bacteroidia bacterium]MDW8416038.1 pyrroline-5-carboxylate reductase [Bacteroidia bacterium]
MKRAVIVGPGVMGETLGGAYRQMFPSGELIYLSPPSPRRSELAQRFGAEEATYPHEVGGTDWLLLALKPQKAMLVLPTLRPLLLPHTVVLSVMAGISLHHMETALHHLKLVRSMPNTPGRIGAGITVWTAIGLTNRELDEIGSFLKGMGETLYVEEESYIDMATALSGTGPAYVFLFMEALMDAGVHMGLPRHIAEKLVVETIAGSVAYYRRNPKGAAILRHEVTSPGGTTAEAVYRLEKAGFRPALSRAVWAAYQRALALRPPLSIEELQSK